MIMRAVGCIVCLKPGVAQGNPPRESNNRREDCRPIGICAKGDDGDNRSRTWATRGLRMYLITQTTGSQTSRNHSSGNYCNRYYSKLVLLLGQRRRSRPGRQRGDTRRFRCASGWQQPALNKYEAPAAEAGPRFKLIMPERDTSRVLQDPLEFSGMPRL